MGSPPPLRVPLGSAVDGPCPHFSSVAAFSLFLGTPLFPIEGLSTLLPLSLIKPLCLCEPFCPVSLSSPCGRTPPHSFATSGNDHLERACCESERNVPLVLLDNFERVESSLSEIRSPSNNWIALLDVQVLNAFWMLCSYEFSSKP